MHSFGMSFSFAVGRVTDRERNMPGIDLATLLGTLVRPFVVAIAHLPILFVVLFMFPMWVGAAVRPRTHGAPALRFLSELRGWSSDVVAGSRPHRAGVK